MITVVYRAQDVTPAGWELVRNINKWSAKQNPDFRYDTLTNLSGKTNSVLWVFRHKSLAAYEEQTSKREADPSWTKLLKDAGPGPFWSNFEVLFYRDVEP